MQIQFDFVTSELTPEDAEALLDNIIQFVESKDASLGGGFVVVDDYILKQQAHSIEWLGENPR